MERLCTLPARSGHRAADDARHSFGGLSHRVRHDNDAQTDRRVIEEIIGTAKE